MPKKIFTGKVVSDKMDKTVVVEVTRLVQHPLYKKTVKYRKKFMAHDEENRCKVGDIVSIIESRPLSKRKRWVVIDILKKGGGEETVEEAPGEEVSVDTNLESNSSGGGLE
jgi:small subunit ribosomal protein S17